MAGFIRRFTSFPDVQTITAIEGVNIIDQTPPGIFVGRTTGTVALVGEWPKGPVNTPVEVEGARTLTNVFGGFSLSMADPLSFSAGSYTHPFSNGCAFAWLKNKSFRRLILARPDLTLAEGVNVQLLNQDGAPATGSIDVDSGGAAVLPLQDEEVVITDALGTAVTFRFDLAGTVVQTATLRQVDISGAADELDVAAALLAAINATPNFYVLASSGGAGIVDVQQTLTGTSGNVAITDTVIAAGFTTTGFAGGTGTVNSSVILEEDVTIKAGTRVRDASSPNVEFALADDLVFAAGTNVSIAGTSAYDDEALSYSNRTISDVPVYSTRNTSEAVIGDVDEVDSVDLFQSGIGVGANHPELTLDVSTGVLDAAAANLAVLTVLTSAQIDTRYEAAIDSLQPGDPTVDNIEFVASARESDTIRVKLRDHARDASQVGTGRVALIRPAIGTDSTTARSATGDGVGVTRLDRVFYCYPHFKQRLSELEVLDPGGDIVSSSTILVGADAAMAHILSNQVPEANPGAATGRLGYITGLEDDLTTAGQPTRFGLQDYINFKASGIAALRRDNRIGEWVFQSGVTSVDPSLYPSLAPISRRRMADFVQDSLAAISLRYNKQTATEERYDSLVGELFDFLDTLLSENNPSQQRIAEFSLDSRSGNTAQLTGLGIRVVEIAVRTLGSLDHIVLQTEIGDTVEVSAVVS